VIAIASAADPAAVTLRVAADAHDAFSRADDVPAAAGHPDAIATAERRYNGAPTHQTKETA
jgi:hypothetical protein